MLSAGFQVRLMPKMHEHYAIIDGEIVWYGSMNLLSAEKEEEFALKSGIGS